MTKKELKALDKEELFIEFVKATLTLKYSGYRIYKCDIKRFNYACEEILNRELLTKETLEVIWQYATK